MPFWNIQSLCCQFFGSERASQAYISGQYSLFCTNANTDTFSFPPTYIRRHIYSHTHSFAHAYTHTDAYTHTYSNPFALTITHHNSDYGSYTYDYYLSYTRIYTDT